MKKVLIAILMLCLAGFVQADILTNNGLDGGFESGSYDDGYGSQVPNGYALSWSGDWNVIDHEAELQSVTGRPAHTGDAYWMLAGGGNTNGPQTVVGSVGTPLAAIPGHTYTFGAWIRRASGDVNIPSNIEFGFDQYTMAGAWNFSDAPPLNMSDVNDTWQYFEYTTVATGIYIAPKIAPFGNTGFADGLIYTDDWTLIDPATRYQATDPSPADDANVPLNMAALGWNNPDPENPVDTITWTVKISTDPCLVTSVSTKSGTSNGHVDVNLADLTPPLTLADGPFYYWRVDSYDPNTGGTAVTTPSELWKFKVGDVPAEVNAGADQYNWLSMNDGDGNDALLTFNLHGTYTDDGKSTITRAEWIQGAHQGGGTVTIVSQDNSTPGVVDAVVTATNTGWLFLTLEVEDASGVGSDTMNVGVYGTCLEAAQEDPTDPLYHTYGLGDIDGDCDTDLADLALLAETWQSCMTPKAGCTP